MANYLGLIDMLNGGGAGRAGDTFEGGPLSDFLNSLGIRPMGYQDRLSAARLMPQPGPRPAYMAPPARPTPAQPPANIYGPGAITTTPIGQMTDAQLLRLIQNAIQAPPSAVGYGPR